MLPPCCRPRPAQGVSCWSLYILIRSIAFAMAFVLFSPTAQAFVIKIRSSRPFSSLVSNRRKITRIRSAIPEESGQTLPSEDDGIGVGIDLGTTYSCVAMLVDGIPNIIPVPNNGRTVPSVVSFDSDNRVLVGRDAIENEVDNPTGSYRNVKRVIGTGGIMARETAEVVPNLVIQESTDQRGGGGGKRKKKKKRPGLVEQIEDAQQNPAVLYLPLDSDEKSAVRGTVGPEVISSHVLATLFDAAERHTGKKVTRAVVGVPAYFHDAQRDATIRACQLAGVSKVKLLREPEAAAFAYGIGKEQIGQGDDDELVLVFDLGGGTYDVSVLNVGGGVTEVIATGGDTLLGGSDFDARIAQYFDKVMKNHGLSRNFVSAGGEVADAMVRAAEAVRIYLSNNRVANLALPLTEEGWSTMPHAADVIIDMINSSPDNIDLTEEGISNSTHALCQLSRKSMELLCQQDFQALLRPVREVAIMSGALLPGDARPSMVEAALELEEEMDRAISDAGGGAPFEFGDFYSDERKELASSATTADTVELEGADSNTLLELQEFNMKERKRLQQKGRKKARDVAKRERKFRQEKRKVDTAADTDVKIRDGINGRPISQVVLVGGATRMPAIGRLLAALTGVVPQRTVNPDEAVALGCAVQVGLLDDNKDLGGLMVLNPMQAAIMRAVAIQNGLHIQEESDFDDDFDDDFD